MSNFGQGLNECIEFSTLDVSCSYLNGATQRTHYKYIDKCTTSYNTDLVSRGWRRFGRYFSRPVCSSCNACESVKIDATNYKFSKSERRIMKKNKNTKIFIQKPTLSLEHINLYNKYHKYKSETAGWAYRPITPNNYYSSFVEGHEEFGKEVLYFVDNKLVGVDLIDILDDGISSIYFYYDPEYLHLALGKYSIYVEIDIAKRNNLNSIYLGYSVKSCQSLNYKEQYKPLLRLVGKPELEDEYEWR